MVSILLRKRDTNPQPVIYRWVLSLPSMGDPTKEIPQMKRNLDGTYCRKREKTLASIALSPLV